MNLDDKLFDFLLLLNLRTSFVPLSRAKITREKRASAQREGSTGMICSSGLFVCEDIHDHLCIQNLCYYEFCAENNFLRSAKLDVVSVISHTTMAIFSGTVRNEKLTSLTISSTMYCFWVYQQFLLLSQ